MKTETIAVNFCAMCGATENDAWETETARCVVLRQQRRFGDESGLWILCDECHEGLQNIAPLKPDRLHLLAQIRRATIDDQRAVLNWLLQKFALDSAPKSKSDI